MGDLVGIARADGVERLQLARHLFEVFTALAERHQLRGADHLAHAFVSQGNGRAPSPFRSADVVARHPARAPRCAVARLGFLGNERRNENEKFLFAIVALMIAAFPTIGMAENKRVTSLMVSLRGDDDGNLQCSVSSFQGVGQFFE